MEYFLSCEGETEQWYFEWLKNQINGDKRVEDKVSFIYRNNIMPSSFAKSNNGTFTKKMVEGSYFCRIQDIEEYDPVHIRKFHCLLKSNKEAKKLFPRFNFYIGYSNFTFEVWILSHKMDVKTLVHRKDYFKEINKAFNTHFIDNDDYKHQDNFRRILNSLSLDDVINGALPRCERFKTAIRKNIPNKVRQMYGFDYIMENPDTTLDDFVKIILHNAGLI